MDGFAKTNLVPCQLCCLSKLKTVDEFVIKAGVSNTEIRLKKQAGSGED